MSSNRYQQIAAPASTRPTAVSQATAIEQSRAVAEVQASVFVAQQNRRNKALALAEMRDATAEKAVAERAFFRFPRAGGAVSGPSIHLARELARCWGNINFGVTELRRDDAKGESEMQAYAWDLETNARTATTFIVPHKLDTKQGAKELVEMRDIYENNANNGARRLREAIFTVLPGWFVEEAQENCRATLAGDGGSKTPFPQRIANSIGAFAGIGVTVAQLEGKLGRSSTEWTEADLSELTISFRSIKNGDIARDVEFPPARVTVAEIASNQGGKPDTAQVEAPKRERAVEKSPAKSETRPTSRAVALLGKALVAAQITPSETAAFLSGRVGREVRGGRDLTGTEIEQTIKFLETGEEPAAPAPEAIQPELTEGTDQ